MQQTHTHTTTEARRAPWGAPKARLVCFAANLSSWHIHQEMVYTRHSLILSRPKLGGGDYIYGAPM